MPSPLSSPQLRRILAAYTVNRLGTWFGLVALSLAVFDHTHSALAVAALLLAWQALPAFIVPAVVARIEASQRGHELSGLYFFEAVTTAALAALLWHFWLPAVLLLAAIDGTAALAASALLRAEVARTAREEVKAAPGSATGADDRIGAQRSAIDDLSVRDASHEAERKANAALNVAFSITFVLGPALAGAVVAAAGAPAALFIDAGSFLLCGMLLTALRSHVEEAGDNSVRARLRAAWRHVNETPSLRALLLVEAVALVFSESVGPVEVTYAKTTLHAGDRGYGILLTAWGAGAVLGSLVFARSLRRPLGAMLGGGTLAAGLAYVGFAAAPSLLLACIAALVGGIGNGLEAPSLISIVQRITPKHLHGQMMGAVESLIAVCIAIGLPLGGVLVALSSPRGAFLVLGLVTAATSVALFRVSPRRLASVMADEAPTTATGSDLPTPENATVQTGVP